MKDEALLKDIFAANYDFGVSPLITARVACLPLHVARRMFDTGELDSTLRDLIESRPDILTAIWLASPSLAHDAQEWLKSNRKDPRIEKRILAYVIRMGTRTTPFGAFAGIGVVDDYEESGIVLESFQLHPKLDMGWLFSFIDQHESELVFSDALPVSRNDAVVRRAGRIHILDTRRSKMTIDGPVCGYPVSIKDSPAVQLVFDASDGPITMSELSEKIQAKFGASFEESRAFLRILWDAAMLLPTLRRADLSLDRVIVDLGTSVLGSQLLDLKVLLKELEETQCRQLYNYAQVAARMSSLRPAPYYVRADTTCTISGGLNKAVLEDAAELANIMLRMTKRSRLGEYREKFERRYGDGGQLIPILELVDHNWGIGPPNDVDFEPNWTQGDRTESLLRIGAICYRLGHLSYQLSEAELNIIAPGVDSARTLSSFEMGFCIEAQSIEDVSAARYMLGPGSFYAANDAIAGVGRFARDLGQSFIESLRASLKVVTDESLPEVDVVYHPLSPTSLNVCATPPLRSWQVQFGMNDSRSGVTRLDPRKLLIGLQGGRFYVWSTELGREIVPRQANLLTIRDAPPAVQLMLQIGNDEKLVVDSLFDWGEAIRFPFLPRLTRGRLVIAPARWRLDTTAILSSKNRLAALNEWRALWKVPRWVCLSQGDRKLAIDLDSTVATDLLLDQLRSYQHAVSIEELFPSVDSVWFRSTQNEAHAVEFVVSLWKNPGASSPGPGGQYYASRPVFPPGSDWIYVKVYCGVEDADEVIVTVMSAVLEAGPETDALSRWFFVRYTDDATHLRIRLRVTDVSARKVVENRMFESLRKSMERRLIMRFSIDTYDPEIERFGGPKGLEAAESFFERSSVCALRDLETQFSSVAERICGALDSLVRLLTSTIPPHQLDAWLRDQKVTPIQNAKELTLASRGVRETWRSSLQNCEPGSNERARHPEILAANFSHEAIASLSHSHFNRYGLEAGAEKTATCILVRTYTGIVAALKSQKV